MGDFGHSDHGKPAFRKEWIKGNRVCVDLGDMGAD